MLQVLVAAGISSLSVDILSLFSEESSLDLDHAEEMELLLDNYYMQVRSTSLVVNVSIQCATFLSLQIE